MERLEGDLRDHLRQLDPRSVVALVTAAVVLLLVQFLGSSTFWQRTDVVRDLAKTGQEVQFLGQAGWALTTFVAFGVVPFLVATFILRMRPSEFGFRARGLGRHLVVYAVFFLLMSPAIWLASKDPTFRQTYPFPWLARTDSTWFWRWQALYFLQFCALEMFFRGFLVFSLERRFGLHGVFVMTIPYAMIHLHKPMPEAFGAIFAGIILGYMALRTRSFYGGILLHYAVALSMDLLASAPPSGS